MRKDDIVNALTQKMLDRKSAQEAVELTFNIIREGLKKDGKVIISGFGSFKTVRTRPVVRHNPKTMQKVAVPPQTKVRFKPSDKILD